MLKKQCKALRLHFDVETVGSAAGRFKTQLRRRERGGKKGQGEVANIRPRPQAQFTIRQPRVNLFSCRPASNQSIMAWSVACSPVLARYKYDVIIQICQNRNLLGFPDSRERDKHL